MGHGGVRLAGITARVMKPDTVGGEGRVSGATGSIIE